ncbi:MAG: hypothetical protein WB762_15380 [Candidatus Sulfotelmatobacter sp.]
MSQQADRAIPGAGPPDPGKRLKGSGDVVRHVPNIPVIVLSSLSEKNRQELIEAAAEDYLEKNSPDAGG